jgi:hypothetical protein
VSALLAERSQLDEVFQDPNLLPADRDLYEVLYLSGRALSADAVWTQHLVPGGRDVIRASMRRLKQGDYIRVQKQMLSPGHWRNEQVFADQVRAPEWGVRLVPDLVLEDAPEAHCYQSGVQVLGGLGVQSQSQDQEIKKEEEKNTLLPSPQAASEPPEHPTPKENTHMLRGRDRDDVDIANPLASVPERPSRPAPRGTATRRDKAPDRWTSFDLTAEFNSRAYRVAGDVPNQTNAKNLGGALGRMLHNGSSSAALAQCIEIFFANPRNLRDLGEGEPPLWRRFLAEITHTYGTAQKILAHDTILDDEHYAESVAIRDAQIAAMPAIDAENRRIDEERAKSHAAAAAEALVARQKREDDAERVRGEMLTYQAQKAQNEAQQAAEKQAEFLRLRAESQARLAEHPDEEWVVEDEEEWIPSDDDEMVVVA